MSERLPKHLFDALTAAELVLQFAQGVDVASYGADAMRRSAIECQMEVLGQACRRALDDHPDLPGLVKQLKRMLLALPP